MEWRPMAFLNSFRSLLRQLNDGSANRTIAKKKKLQLGLEYLETRELPATGLVAAFNFNEGTGNVLHDLSGNNNNGTISNATWSATGKYGQSLSFNGTNALVSVADAASLDLTRGMTLEAWVNPTALGTNWRSVILKERPGGLSYAMYADDPSQASNGPSAYVNL